MLFKQWHILGQTFLKKKEISEDLIRKGFLAIGCAFSLVGHDDKLDFLKLPK